MMSKNPNKNSLSIFQILKQNTSMRNEKKIAKEEICPPIRKKSVEDLILSRKNSQDKIVLSRKNSQEIYKHTNMRKGSTDSLRKNNIDIISLERKLSLTEDFPLNRIKMIKSTQKYNPSDSESDQDKEDQIEEYDNFKRKRKASVDSFTEKERKLKKSINRKKEKILRLIKQHKIICEGDETLRPVNNFTKIIRKYNIDDNLVQTLKLCDYKHPTPIQMISIPALFKKKNLIALAPTGSGKTAAFGIPLITMLELHKSIGLRALVLSPTHELANQLHRELSFLNHKIKNKIEIKLISKMNTKVICFKDQIQYADVLVTTPLKFLKLVKRAEVDLNNVEFVIMDEADKYFELGFTRQIKQILQMFKEKKSTIALFSATIQHGVEELMNNFLIDPVKIVIGGKNNVLNTIEQSLVYVGNEYGKLIEIKNLVMKGEFYPPILIFVQSKERAIDLHDELQNENLKIQSIHSGKSKQERDQIITDFRYGKIWVLICTELMGRGIDFKNVNLVINYDFPNTMINYIHRVGRTGRANQKGKAITFFSDEDRPLLRSLGNMLKISGCPVPDWVLRVDKIDRNTKKRLAKFPVKRETLSRKIEKNIDREFQFEMKIRDKIFLKKLKREQSNNQKEININATE